MRLRDTEIDAFLDQAERWQGEMAKLREILLGCGLEEGLKWGKPCYMHEGRNIAIIQPFREICALMFFKGALLTDARGLLRRPGENSRSARRLEFTGEAGIGTTVVRSYVKQAIDVEKAGLAVDLAQRREPELPAELTRIMKRDEDLAKAFRALSPGRRRGYVLHFAAAKRPETRVARIERCIPRILSGKGLNDR